MLFPSDLEYINQRLLHDSTHHHNRRENSHRDGFPSPLSPNHVPAFWIRKPIAQTSAQNLPRKGIEGPSSKAAKRRSMKRSIAMCGPGAWWGNRAYAKRPPTHFVPPKKFPCSGTPSPESQKSDGMRDCTVSSFGETQPQPPVSGTSGLDEPMTPSPPAFHPVELWRSIWIARRRWRRNWVINKKKLAVLRGNVAWNKIQRRFRQSASY